MSMLRKIQRHKPRCVIAAASHALAIKELVSPRETIFHNPAWLEYGKTTPEYIRERKKNI